MVASDIYSTVKTMPVADATVIVVKVSLGHFVKANLKMNCEDMQTGDKYI